MAIEAQFVCIRCPVRKECDDYRERTGSDVGVWGGRQVKRGEK